MAKDDNNEWVLDYTAPVRDYQFILETLNLPEHAAAVDPEMVGYFDEMLEQGADFAKKELFSWNRKGDEEGLTFKDGEVITPAEFKKAWAKYVQAGYPAANCDPEFGGMGLPNLLNVAISEFFSGANISFGLLPGLSHGAYSALHAHASEDLKLKLLPQMVSGEWSGAMALTEPQAGSDLGLITTKAEPTGNGTYAVSGQKIFISCGEQDVTGNIIHLVLARLPGAPEGTKGISLLAVPKYKINKDGSLGERNGVTALGIEKKQGMHASPTCTMSYEEAEGYLVGEPHKGMSYMFTMMNEERLYVGVQGLGLGEVAYQNALRYAQARVQGKPLEKTLQKAPSDTIIKHPDVARMMWEMKSFTEGGRALAAQTALMTDIAAKHPDEAERAKAEAYVDLMTPIIKAYLTDGGLQTTITAQQVFGGAGYIRETGMAQFVDDARIAPIYEGTNGIQAMDLVGRKLSKHDLGILLDPIRAQIEETKKNPDLQSLVAPLEAAIESLVEGKDWLLGKGLEGLSGDAVKLRDLGAGATDFLKLMGHVAMGGIWLQQAAAAQAKLAAGDLSEDDKPFYEAKIATANFFQTRILATEHASLLAKVKCGADILEMPGIYTTAANSNVAASIVAEGPKGPLDQAATKSAAVGR